MKAHLSVIGVVAVVAFSEVDPRPPSHVIEKVRGAGILYQVAAHHGCSPVLLHFLITVHARFMLEGSLVCILLLIIVSIA